MKNDAVRRISMLNDNDAKTMESIWLFVSSALPSDKDKITEEEERTKSKELAHFFLGAFSESRFNNDWKDVKENYLVEKYENK